MFFYGRNKMDQVKLSSFAKSVVMATSSQQDVGEGEAKGQASAGLLAANEQCDTFSDGPKKDGKEYHWSK